MILLDIKYELKKINDMIYIENVIENKVELAFKTGKISISRLKEICYFGKAEGGDCEKKLLYLLSKQYPQFFFILNDSIDIAGFKIVRENTQLMKDTFINEESLRNYYKRVSQFLKEGKKIDTYIYLPEDQYKSLDKLINNPFFDLKNEVDSSDNFDLIIADYSFLNSDKIDLFFFKNILLLNVTEKFIEIGPIVNNEKFSLSTLKAEHYLNTRLIDDEIHILTYFLSRIIYVFLFNLNESAEDIQFYPNRYKLKLDRAKLTLTTEDFTILPAYMD